MNKNIIMSKLLSLLLNILPEGCIMYVGLDLDAALKDGYFSDLHRFYSKGEVYYGWYDYQIPLTPLCVEYLKKEIETRPNLMLYLIHYAIVKDEQFILRVFDTYTISILDTIMIPENLISDCKNNSEINLYIENPVT